LKIQRDDTTQHWRERFLEEIKTKPFLDHTVQGRTPYQSKLSYILNKQKTWAPCAYEY
jgi:hypothetical protein